MYKVEDLRRLGAHIEEKKKFLNEMSFPKSDYANSIKKSIERLESWEEEIIKQIANGYKKAINDDTTK